MKIGIDASSINAQKAGVGHFTYNLIQALIKSDEHTFHLYTNDQENIKDLSLNSNVVIEEIKNTRGGFQWILKSAQHANKNMDFFISPSNFMFGVLVKNSIQVIHDIAPIKFPKFFKLSGALKYRIQLELVVRRCKEIAVPLETIRQELIELYPKHFSKISVIGEGLKKFEESDDELIRRKYNLPENYILTTGTLEPRKNHLNTIKAFKNFLRTNPDFFYVVVGKKGWFYEEIFEIVKKMKLEERVIFLGYVADSDMGTIYKFAKGFAYCSFYEGFGLPVLEAASFNLPIICSDIDSFKEIFGDQVLYANPEDPISISQGMRGILNSKELNYSEILKKYTWENSANSLLKRINL